MPAVRHAWTARRPPGERAQSQPFARRCLLDVLDGPAACGPGAGPAARGAGGAGGAPGGDRGHDRPASWCATRTDWGWTSRSRREVGAEGVPAQGSVPGGGAGQPEGILERRCRRLPRVGQRHQTVGESHLCCPGAGETARLTGAAWITAAAPVSASASVWPRRWPRSRAATKSKSTRSTASTGTARAAPTSPATWRRPVSATSSQAMDLRCGRRARRPAAHPARRGFVPPGRIGPLETTPTGPLLSGAWYPRRDSNPRPLGS